MTAPVRLSIGHWFSTAYHFVKLLRDNPDGRKFEIFGTSKNPYSTVLHACDQAFLEPRLEQAAYVDFCLEFCGKHKIEVFVPGYRRLTDIAPYAEEFRNLGTRLLLCGDAGVMELLDDKGKTYESVKGLELMPVPEYALVSTAAQFEEFYQRLIGEGHQVCFKPRASQGGAGFRIIDNHYDTLASLYYVANVRISFNHALRLLASEPSFPELLVSEYLNGAEYSIDCLAYQGKLYAAVPRRKMDGRLRYLEENPELLEIARRMTEAYGLSYTFNIQLRYKNGIPKLLEVNPRMPGGLHISCMSGINFPYLSVKLLLEGQAEVPAPRLNQLVSEVEQALPVVRVSLDPTL